MLLTPQIKNTATFLQDFTSGISIKKDSRGQGLNEKRYSWHLAVMPSYLAAADYQPKERLIVGKTQLAGKNTLN